MGSICQGFSLFTPQPPSRYWAYGELCEALPLAVGPETSGAERCRHPGADSPLDAAREVPCPALGAPPVLSFGLRK